MKRTVIAVALVALVASSIVYAAQQARSKWKRGDGSRPMPRVVTPGKHLGDAPSDAVVLFDGTDMSQWVTDKGEPPRWTVKDGYMQVVPKTGYHRTKRSFGDCQLHVEWSADPTSTKTGQGRSNSGVFLMGIYEMQVLDNYANQNKTYADGMAGGIYKQKPPDVNAARPAGQWQSYDIVFRAPRFSADGKLLSPATITAFVNGVLVHDNFELWGPTTHKAQPPYRKHADKLPLKLQDHGDKVRFRNIWVRELPPRGSDPSDHAE